MGQIIFLLSISLLLFSNLAFAENRSGAATLTPMVGYHMIDGGMDLDDETAFGLSLGYNVNAHFGLEGDARYTSTQTDRGGAYDRDMDIWAVSLGGLYHFQPQHDLNPYLSLGGGGLIYDLEGASNKDEDYMIYWGGGLKYALDDSASLRLDLRHMLDYLDDTSGSNHENGTWRHHMQAMMGVTFQLGGVSKAPARAGHAEALTESAAVAVTPVDGDHDGVLDHVDKCLGTAPGVRVNTGGCPADTDGDGIFDFHDACIDTPKGAVVDSRGCHEDPDPVDEMILHINFDTDKDTVTPFHRVQLAKAVELINKYPGHKIEVEGHTDSVGDLYYNQNLSARRAENVRKALVESYAIAVEQTVARGFGEGKPLASNETVEGRQMNRRVEVEILKPQE
jgi:OOP family OmpA-OmpF porin